MDSLLQILEFCSDSGLRYKGLLVSRGAFPPGAGEGADPVFGGTLPEQSSSLEESSAIAFDPRQTAGIGNRFSGSSRKRPLLHSGQLEKEVERSETRLVFFFVRLLRARNPDVGDERP